MTCRASGFPTPVVSWIRDGEVLTGGRYIYNPVQYSDLTIYSGTFVDAGSYTCFASNKYGSDNQTAELIVKEHTRIVDVPKDIQVYADQTALFHCYAVADDTLTLTIRWLRDRKNIDFEAERRLAHLENNSLAIYKTSVGDSGNYRCIASTKLDTVIAEATLTVLSLDKPSAPEIAGIVCNERAATINWRAWGNGSSPILYYSIQFETSFTPDSWENTGEDVPATESSHTVSLSPWVNYTFRVIAHNKIGPSEPSAHSDVCTTPTDVPFVNPVNARGYGNRPDNLVISWTPMTKIQQNAPNFRYRVRWKLKDDRGMWNREEITDPSWGNITIPNQPTYTPFIITVRAVNEHGQCHVEPVEILGFSGQDKPLLAPENFTLLMEIDYKTVVVSWSPVPSGTIRGKLEGYKVEYWTDNDVLGEVVLKNGTTQARIGNLIPLTKNYLRVCVYNSYYDGPPSDVLAVIMKEGFPGPVELFQAFPLSQSALYLHWKKPLETNGSLKGYEIYYQTVNGTEVGVKKKRNPTNVSPERTSAKLWGLQRGVKYRVHIHAKTASGEGPGCFAEETTYSQPALSLIKPRFRWSLHDSSNGFSIIRVEWKPILEGGGRPGSNFYIQYKRSDEFFTQATPTELQEDFQDIRGLASNKTYVLRLVTVDGNVEQGSEPENFHTFPLGSDVTYYSTAKVAEEGVSDTVTGISIAAGLVLATAIFLAIVFWRKYKVAVNVIRNLTKQEVDEFHLGKGKAEGDGKGIPLESAPFTDDKKIRSEDLKIESIILGEGHFGIVHKGIFQEQSVAVKSSKSSADVEYFKAFLKEIKVMVYIGDHENVVRFFGAVIDRIEERLCQAVMELSPYGDLNSFLRKHSKHYSDAQTESIQASPNNEITQEQVVLNYATLMSFCRQIASGMNFLAQKHVIHGDLAARNVLVFQNGVAKITDFGLSRKLYNCANYIKKNACPLPWRWMAIETLSFFEFSTKSDVWSFGVTMWEILSLGQVPFAGVNWNTDFVDQLKSGFRLTKPHHCTPVVYDWMQRCWENLPEERPTFSDCLGFLPIPKHAIPNDEIETYYYPIERFEIASV